MSSIAKLNGSDFDRMVLRGAFNDLEPLKIELIHGELRFKNPSGPKHEGEVVYLTDWSYANTNRKEISIRVQSSIDCGNHRPEPDLVWARKADSRRTRPTQESILLLIEVSDSSLEQDLGEKATLYAEHQIPEYWVVDIPAEHVHVHRTPLHGYYQSIRSFGKSASLSPLCQPLATLSLADLFNFDA